MFNVAVHVITHDNGFRVIRTFKIVFKDVYFYDEVRENDIYGFTKLITHIAAFNNAFEGTM